MAQEQTRLAVRHREAARMLGISEKTLYLWVKQGLIPCKKVGRAVIYAVLDLEAFLQRKVEEGSPDDGIDRQ